MILTKTIIIQLYVVRLIIITIIRTVLIQKGPTKGRALGNYRPVTCLPVAWKLMTSMIADEMYQYLEDNGMIGEKQKGFR